MPDATFPARSEALTPWVQSLTGEQLRQAVSDRLSVSDPATGERRLGRYITQEDISTLVAYLRGAARSGLLSWEAYFEEERAILDTANLRMGMATGAVQEVEANDGSSYHESTMPVENVETENGTYLLVGPLAATIRDDGSRITYRLYSFGGSFPVANAIYTMARTGDINLEASVEKGHADWRAAQSVVFREFEKLYQAGDAKVREVVTHVLGARA